MNVSRSTVCAVGAYLLTAIRRGCAAGWVLRDGMGAEPPPSRTLAMFTRSPTTLKEGAS